MVFTLNQFDAMMGYTRPQIQLKKSEDGYYFKSSTGHVGHVTGTREEAIKQITEIIR